MFIPQFTSLGWIHQLKWLQLPFTCWWVQNPCLLWYHPSNYSQDISIQRSSPVLWIHWSPNECTYHHHHQNSLFRFCPLDTMTQWRASLSIWFLKRKTLESNIPGFSTPPISSPFQFTSFKPLKSFSAGFIYVLASMVSALKWTIAAVFTLASFSHFQGFFTDFPWQDTQGLLWLGLYLLSPSCFFPFVTNTPHSSQVNFGSFNYTMILHMLFLLLVMPFLSSVVFISKPLVVFVGLLGYALPELHIHSIKVEMKPRPHWPAPTPSPWGSSLGIDAIVCEVHSNEGDGCSKSRSQIWIKSSFAF